MTEAEKKQSVSYQAELISRAVSAKFPLPAKPGSQSYQDGMIMPATIQQTVSSAHPVLGSRNTAVNDTSSQRRKETEKKETLARQIVVSTEEKQRG